MLWNTKEFKTLFTTGIEQSNATINNAGISGPPLYNEPVASTVPGVYKSNVGTARELMKHILRSPECLGIFKAIMNDLLHDFHFESISEAGPGRKKSDAPKIQKAEEFAKKHMIMQEFEKAIFDWLVTGDFYLWKGIPKVNMDVAKTKFVRLFNRAVNKTVKDFNFQNIEVKETSLIMPSGKEIEFKASEFFDEDERENMIQHAAATTVEPVYNSERVIGFKQAVGTAELVDSTGTRVLNLDVSPSGLIERHWDAKEIIHGKFMDVDGKVWGFSPTQALLPIITTLSLHKDYMGHFFDNNGVPNWMFFFKKATPNHSSVKALTKQLALWRKNQLKHRNLIITGNDDINAKELNRFDKDMEFRQLAVYYTGLIALTFNMTIDRIQSIVVDKSPKDSDINDTAYWRSISKGQKYLASLLNGQFFNDVFGVDIVFENPFEQDKIRKAQKEAMMWNVGNQMLSMGASSDYVREFLEIPEKYKFELKAGNNTELPQGKSPDNTTNPQYREQKRNEQNKQQEAKQMKNSGF